MSLRGLEMEGFLHKLERIGGRAYFVGGCVRDELMGARPHDRDVVVAGADRRDFEREFDGAVRVGRSFPVYRLYIDGSYVEVALARTEAKTSSGHGGFAVTSTPETTIEEDLYRRDITINAVAKDMRTGELVDPFGGVKDIEDKAIRAVSEHFCDDPLRALRAARFAAVLQFDLTDQTRDLMMACASEVPTLPGERIFNELERALAARRPSVYFRELERTRVLRQAYPLIHMMVGVPQPIDLHPEGDVFEHTMQALDRACAMTIDLKTRFACLMHDVGKGATSAKDLPHHPGHDDVGADLIRLLPHCYRRKWVKTAAFIAGAHMRAAKPQGIEAALRLLTEARGSGSSAGELGIAVLADKGERLASLPWFLDEGVERAVFERVEVPEEIRTDVGRIKAFIERTRMDRLIQISREKGMF